MPIVVRTILLIDDNMILKKSKCPFKLLFVDDCDLHREFFAFYFSKLDISFDIANSGEAALRLAETNSYQMILMDIEMPEMDGFEASMAIRKFDKSVPILAFTSMPETAILEKILAHGMNEYLQKPEAIKTLGKTISKYQTANVA